ncbi:MAG: VOC family protein [Alphaproteobacteria bacterium]|nr:VOC family protein [Alphaproteobacteria bacterium]
MTVIRIKAIDHVVLRVAEMERSIRFYCEVLGCTVERRRPDLGLIHLRAGLALIDLVNLDGPLGLKGGAGADPGPARGGRNMDHLCLQIDPFDADAMAAHLRAHGVEPAVPAPRFGAEGTGPSIYINDPDGNVVELKGPAEGGGLSQAPMTVTPALDSQTT